ncbi:uncharacterized protein LOC143817495 isoform X2 [Ranitomeya variabilis]
MSSSSSSEEHLGPEHGGHESENSSSTAAEAEQEQHGQVCVARRRVPKRDEDLIDNDILISLVHERVLLWDTWVPQHSDNVMIRRLWNIRCEFNRKCETCLNDYPNIDSILFSTHSRAF